MSVSQERASSEFSKQRWPAFVQVVSSIADQRVPHEPHCQALQTAAEASASVAKGVAGSRAASAWEAWVPFKQNVEHCSVQAVAKLCKTAAKLAVKKVVTLRKSNSSLSCDQSSEANPHFEFREGLLVRALRSGAWVVLDEINLAPGGANVKKEYMRSRSTQLHKGKLQLKAQVVTPYSVAFTDAQVISSRGYKVSSKGQKALQ
eukprot:2853436-Amphidinium_carterae.1